MTPVEKGRFCDACAKCVVDLSGKSQTEIKDLYLAHGGNMCGSMPKTQYDAHRQPLAVSTDASNPWNKIRWKRLQIFAASFVAAFGLLWNSTVKAQKPRMLGKIAAHPTTGSVQGIVAHNGTAVAGAQVTVYQGSTRYQTETDQFGRYQVKGLEVGSWQISAYHPGSGTEGWGHIQLEHGQRGTVNMQLESVELMLGDIAVLEPEELTIEEVVTAPIELEEVEAVEIVPQEAAAMMVGRVGPVLTPSEEETTESSEEAQEIMRGQVVEYHPDLEVVLEHVTSNVALPEPEAHKGESAGTVVVAEMDLQLTVKPIPATTQITIRVDVSDNAEPMELLLFDAQGKLLRSGSIHGAAGSVTQMRVDDLAAGVYFLKGLREDYVFNQRILKM